MMSSNLYMKTLQSQEFQLKEKVKYQKTVQQQLHHQSTDPMVNLMKDHHHHLTQQIKNQIMGSNSKTTKNFSSTNKNLNLDFKEKKASNANVEIASQLSRSTKNLYGIISKEKLLDEINGVNETLSKIHDQRKKDGLHILEETLNQRNNSIGALQHSP